jgi:hypothetical protein
MSSPKAKYHEKTASDDAIYVTWLRMLDVVDLFAEYVWLQIPLFDLSQLGLGLLLSILPYEFKPFSIDFTYSAPDMDELMQGIWANFNKVIYELEYKWSVNVEEFVKTFFSPEYWTYFTSVMGRKAKYGIAKFTGYIYDPVLAREFITETFHRLRLLRTPDASWKTVIEQIGAHFDVDDVLVREVYNRLMLLASAQTNSFCLGLSPLGKGTLNGGRDAEGNSYSTVPFVDYNGNYHEVKYYTLDQLQFGFILGVTPLGYGVLLPNKSTYQMEDGKKNPQIVRIVDNKARGAINRLTLSTWAYPNYNKPEEMTNYHKSEKTAQYDYLQKQRKVVEDLVYNTLPTSVGSKVFVRQYQNAVLQAIAWKAKRHKWGFDPYKATTEEQFKSWWLEHWKAQGLDESILNSLYSAMEKWITRLRDDKVSIGDKVKSTRRRMALSA